MGVPNNFAGIYNAIDYAYGAPGKNRPGSLQVGIGTGLTGAATLTLAYSYTTSPDSTQLFPLNTNAPVFVGSGSNQETVTPSALVNANISAGYNTCGLTATFSNTHGIGDPISSGTYGLMEAANAAHAAGGGSVYVTAAWAAAGGTTAMITAANLLGVTNVIIVDNRVGFVSQPYLTATGTIANTAVKALHSAPSLLVAAQGAGTMIDVVSIALENINGGVAYANGGAIIGAFGVAGTMAATASVAATFLTSPTASEIAVLRPASADVGLSSAILNTGLYLAAASADFITGTGSVKYSVSYRVITGF